VSSCLFTSFLCRFVRATITGWDRKAGNYTLEYKDGPYLADEDPDGEVHLKVCTHVKGGVFAFDVSVLFLNTRKMH